VVTVGLELSGPEACRKYIEAANPEHPSLIDETHQMDALFGVRNIPDVVWIGEDGIIVRPAEPGWPGPTAMPDDMLRQVRPARDPNQQRDESPEAQQRREERRAAAARQQENIASGQDRDAYPDAIRDWVAKGAASEFALTPDEVVARSQPRPLTKSEGAAHFELANHLWRSGRRDAAIAHFNACFRLQPDNWTYKRQAWSLVGHEHSGNAEYGRFMQGPVPGREDEWPFESDFRTDVAKIGPGEYYPATL
jgi:hypothetical protein